MYLYVELKQLEKVFALLIKTAFEWYCSTFSYSIDAVYFSFFDLTSS